MWSFYITILVVGFFPRVYMGTCPDEEDVYPCTCRDTIGILGFRKITMTCSKGFFNTLDSLKTLQQSLRVLTGKSNVVLRLEDFNINISSRFFADIGIVQLDFISCRFNSSTNDDQKVLLGLENHLKELGIYHSSTVPAKLNLGHLKQLESIKLKDNKMTELRDGWLGNGSYSLKYLEISGNNITKIGSHAFSQLDNLEKLFLQDNRFGRIKRSMFPTTVRRLKWLNLDNNALVDLPVDIFRRMPAIQRISLQRNGITTLDEVTWFPIWQGLSMLELEKVETSKFHDEEGQHSFSCDTTQSFYYKEALCTRTEALFMSQALFTVYTNIICDDKLKWILKSKLRPQIYGRCSNPRGLEAWERKTVEEFLKSLKQ